MWRCRKSWRAVRPASCSRVKLLLCFSIPLDKNLGYVVHMVPDRFPAGHLGAVESGRLMRIGAVSVAVAMVIIRLYAVVQVTWHGFC